MQQQDNFVWYTFMNVAKQKNGSFFLREHIYTNIIFFIHSVFGVSRTYIFSNS